MSSNARSYGWAAVVLALNVVLCSCGGADPASFNGNSVLPAVKVSVTPQKVSIRTDAVQTFVATVTNTSEITVTWLINGLPGGKQIDGTYPYGTIDSNGNYTAPPYVPAPPQVMITAAASADNRATANAQVLILGSVAPGAVTLSPATASVEAGGIVAFSATVNRKDKALYWLVNNVQGGDLNVGMVYQIPGAPDRAVYVAPSPAPGEAVSVTAQSVVDPTKFAVSQVTVSGVKGAVVRIIEPAQPPTLPLGQSDTFQASVTGVSDTSVTWEVDGIPGGNGYVGRIAPGGNNTATYTAPAKLPNPQQVVVTAVSRAQTNASASMVVSIIPSQRIQVTVSPGECTNPSAVVINSTVQFTASVSGESDQSVTWSVDGVEGGDATYGTITPDGLYTAPGVIPTPNPVTVTAISHADPKAKGSLSITISNSTVLAVTISPKTATVFTGLGQPFIATVLGAVDAAQAEVNWMVNGVNGGDAKFGTITGGAPNGCQTEGDYTAPDKVPDPDHFPVTAVSNFDPTKEASAAVTIEKAPPITVTVSPNEVNVIQDQQQQFSAQVSEQGNQNIDQNVYWHLSGSACSGTECGTLSTTGPSTTTTYTAPAKAPQDVTLTATAEIDAAAKGTATIHVTCGGQPSISIYPDSGSIDANAASPLNFSAVITPCGNQNLNVNWQLGCISLYDGEAGENCNDSDFDGDGPGCTEIVANGLGKICGAKSNQSAGTDPLEYFSPRNLFTNAFAPNVCEPKDNHSGNGMVPLTATVTINGNPYTSPPACITVCAPNAPSCP